LDKVSPEGRSRTMSRIRSKNTKAEVVLRKSLRGLGLRGYRIHYNVTGRPDIVFTSVKLAVFIDGDFWHGYLWKKRGSVPIKQYWKEKISGNMARDKRVNSELKKQGWKVIRIWEHEVTKKPQASALKVLKAYMGLKKAAAKDIYERC
jgi:DNA mismatch endonuclease, patch repair protein